MERIALTRKTAAVTAALALAATAGFAGVSLTATDAFATGTSVSAIDNNQTLSLTLHKLVGAEGAQATGRPLTGVSGTPEDGVSYKIELVKSLQTAADWEEAATIVAGGTEGVTGELKGEDTTANGGVVTFANLEKGLYLVTETGATNPNLEIAAPFFVYLPMTATNSDGTKEWVYDVHAYPKNNEVGITKTVEDKHAQNTNEYNYTITTDVPAVGTGQSLTKYQVWDDIDSRLDVNAGGITVKFVPNAQDAADVILTEGANSDYTVRQVDNQEAAALELDAPEGQLFLIEFTEAGRGKINNNGQVVTTIPASTKAGEFVEHVSNDATLITNNPGSSDDIRRDSKDVDTYWGKLQITKQDGQENSTKLQGAKFELLQCQQVNGTWTQVPNTQPLSINNVSEWETGADGTVTIEGIHVENFANNATDTQTQYCVKETQAPSGYVASTELYEFTLNQEFDAEGNAAVDEKGAVKVANASITIDNFTDKNELPSTGGLGFAGIVAAGLAIVLGGVYAARRSSKASA